MTTLTGSYTNCAIEGTASMGLEGAGSLTVNPDGSLAVTCRVSRVWLARICGSLGVIVTLLFVATIPVMIDSATGFDLMEVRKGPILVAMVALFAMVGAWSAVTAVIDRLFGRKVQVAIAAPKIRSLHGNAPDVVVIFDGEAGPTYLSFSADKKSSALVERLAPPPGA